MPRSSSWWPGVIPGWFGPSMPTQVAASDRSLPSRVRGPGLTPPIAGQFCWEFQRPAGAGEHVVEAEVEEVPDLVVLVERAAEVIEVVEEALHPRVARRVGPAGRSRCPSRCPRRRARRSPPRGAGRRCRRGTASPGRRRVARWPAASASARISSSPRSERRDAGLRGVAQRLRERSVARANGGQVRGQRVQPRRGAAQVGQERRRLAARRSRARPSSAPARAERRRAGRSRSRGRRGAAAEATAVSPASSTKRTTSSERAVELADDLVGVDVQLRDRPVLLGEQPQRLVQVLRGRGRPSGSPRSGSRDCRRARCRTR